MEESKWDEMDRGVEPPGIAWGPFTLRVPMVHTRVAWPELLQGLVVAGATGLGLVPLLQTHFALSFEQSIAFIVIQTLLICSAPIVFGEPYAPGWITPALPLTLVVLLSSDAGGHANYATPSERFQFMSAVSLDLALLLVVMGLTGLGRRFFRCLPAALKGGIILGAAIAALKRVFLDDAPDYLRSQPISTTLAFAVCLLLMFSVPLQKYKSTHRWLGLLASLGLLPGFLAAAVVGPLVGEMKFEIQGGVLWPPFGELFAVTSPLAIGWPSLKMFVDGAPLALMGYVILFGDLVTGAEILRMGKPARPDERIKIDVGRSHLSLAIRNGIMALIAPFFPLQGALWTGVHVVIVQRWSTGPAAMNSLFSGISSYYIFGIPVLYFLLPVLTLLKPLMGIALSLTLLLTGFTCAYLAMELPRTNVERGVVLLMAVTLAVFANPWIGMFVGMAATLALLGPESMFPLQDKAPDRGGVTSQKKEL
jgi:hypothetical protein